MPEYELIFTAILFSLGSHKAEESPMQMSSSFDIVTVESEMQEQVDENHPIVRDLVSAGYTVEQSIDGVEKYETLDATMEYLEQQVLDGDNEADLIPSGRSYNQQSSNDALEDLKMTWYVTIILL